MSYQQVLALDEPGSEARRVNPSAPLPPTFARWGVPVGGLFEKSIWMFRRGEGIGWMLALALNISAAGWLGVAIWTFIFAISILLETAAEPIQPGD